VATKGEKARNHERKRTCGALRWRLTFPPDIVVVVIVVIVVISTIIIFTAPHQLGIIIIGRLMTRSFPAT
jgi:hypothetical protein